MRSVRYGTRLIEYSIQERNGLKTHYISVEKHQGVVLKGKPVSDSMADRLILKKAKWILDKLQVVKAGDDGDIVTGSRIPYLGKSYYVQLVVDANAKTPRVTFNQSKFVISVRNHKVEQSEILAALQEFYKEKAVEKISPRVEKLSQKAGLLYQGLQFRKMSKRWGSCTASNRIIINTDAVKLPFSLIDYLIVHELVHTKVKDHSKRFWLQLAKYKPDWKRLDEKMSELKM
jgi:predicted metal-dependent hydrolase